MDKTRRGAFFSMENLVLFSLLILSWTADALDVRRREVDREDVINRFEMERVSPLYFGGDLPPFEWTTPTGPPPEFRVEVSKDEEHVVSHSGRRFRTNAGWWYSIEAFSSNNVSQNQGDVVQDSRTLLAGQQGRFLATGDKDGLLQYDGFVSESNLKRNGSQQNRTADFNRNRYSFVNDSHQNIIHRDGPNTTFETNISMSSPKRDDLLLAENIYDRNRNLVKEMAKQDKVLNYTISDRRRPSRNRDENHVVSQRRGHLEVLELPATPQVTVVTLPPPEHKPNVTTRYILLQSGRVVAINVTSAVTKVLTPKSTSKGKVKAPVLPPANFGNRVKKKEDKNANKVSTEDSALNTPLIKTSSKPSRAPRIIEQKDSTTPQFVTLADLKLKNTRTNTHRSTESMVDSDLLSFTTAEPRKLATYKTLQRVNDNNVRTDDSFLKTTHSVFPSLATKAPSNHLRNTFGSSPTVIYYNSQGNFTKPSLEPTSKTTFTSLPMKKPSTPSPNKNIPTSQVIPTATPIFRTFISDVPTTVKPKSSQVRNPKFFVTNRPDVVTIPTPSPIVVPDLDWNRAVPISPDIAENKAQLLKPLEPKREIEQRQRLVSTKPPTMRTTTRATTPVQEPKTDPTTATPIRLKTTTPSLIDKEDIETFIRLDPISRAVATGLKTEQDFSKDQTKPSFKTEGMVSTLITPTSQIYKDIYNTHLIKTEKSSTRDPTRSTVSTRNSAYTEPQTSRSNKIVEATTVPQIRHRTVPVYPKTSTRLPSSSNKLISPFVVYESSTRPPTVPITNDLTTFYRELETFRSNRPLVTTSELPLTRPTAPKQNTFDKIITTRITEPTTYNPRTTLRATGQWNIPFRTTQPSRLRSQTLPPKNILDTILNVLNPKTSDVPFLVVTYDSAKENSPLQRLQERREEKDRELKVNVVQYSFKPTVAATQRWKTETSSGIPDAVTMSRGRHDFVRLVAMTTPLPQVASTSPPLPPQSSNNRRGRPHHLRNSVGFQTIGPGALSDRRALSPPSSTDLPPNITERPVARGFKFDPTRRSQTNSPVTSTTASPTTTVSRHTRPTVQPLRAVWTRSDSRTTTKTTSKPTSTKEPVERTRISRVEENPRSMRRRPTTPSRDSPKVEESPSLETQPETTPKPFKVYYFEPKRRKSKKVEHQTVTTSSSTPPTTSTRRSRPSAPPRSIVSYTPPYTSATTPPPRRGRARFIDIPPPSQLNVPRQERTSPKETSTSQRNVPRQERTSTKETSASQRNVPRQDRTSLKETSTSQRNVPRQERTSPKETSTSQRNVSRQDRTSLKETSTSQRNVPRQDRTSLKETSTSQRNVPREERTSPKETTTTAATTPPKMSKKPWYNPFIRHRPNVGGTTAVPKTTTTLQSRGTSSEPSRGDLFPLPPASSFQEVLFPSVEIRRIN